MLKCGKVKKVIIFDNSKTRYSISKIYSQTGCDFVFNGGLFNSDYSPCCPIKIDGAVKKTDNDVYLGFGWSPDDLVYFIGSDEMDKVDNFISCVCIVHAGQAEPTYGTDKIDGKTARTAWGIKADGTHVFYCGTAGMSISDLTAYMLAQGCYNAIMLDGGGSSQCMSADASDRVVSTDAAAVGHERIVANLVCVWFDHAICGVDTDTPITAAVASALAARGYQFVCRYLRNLTAAEAKILTDYGLHILTVFETVADRAKSGQAYGTADGAMALKAAQSIGMPAGKTIFFAVDYDAGPLDYKAIEAYITAARAAVGGYYMVGLYAGYKVIEEMAQRGACTAFWQAYGWAHGNGHSSHATVFQTSAEQRICDIGVDTDEALNYIDMWLLPEAPAFTVGDKVKIKPGTKTYDGQSLASFVYSRVNAVKSISGDKAVVAYGGVVVAAVNIEDLVKV